MGRDSKPSTSQEPSKIAFPTSRRPSIVSSFSLPSLSLSSRSKAAATLSPLDTGRANGTPLDADSSTCSSITPSMSQPVVSTSVQVSSRPSSPLKPPSSPNTSVPLPSIRSLRNRFSFSSQDPPNLPSSVQAPAHKRVSSRRFLPFGSSASSNQPTNNTPNIPRKSLGDVFALGRSSTSSRFDSTSTRSATPSGRSARSVTSTGTMRGPGGWNHLAGLAPPNSVVSSRPRSDDFSSLGADLGYVISIGVGDETVRRRNEPPQAESLIHDSTPTVDESSQEDIVVPSFEHNPSDSQSELSPSLATPLAGASPGVDISCLGAIPQSASVAQRRQSPVPPISIPSSSVSSHISMLPVGSFSLEANTVPTTGFEVRAAKGDPSRSDYPFTPVDDRSDIGSSTSNTPHSGRRSVRKASLPVPPMYPSSPQTAMERPPVLPSPISHPGANSMAPCVEIPVARAQSEACNPVSQDPSPGHLEYQLRMTDTDSRSGLGPGVSATKIAFGPTVVPSSALGLVDEDSRSIPQYGHQPSTAQMRPDPREYHANVGQLLPRLDRAVLEGIPPKDLGAPASECVDAFGAVKPSHGLSHRPTVLEDAASPPIHHHGSHSEGPNQYPDPLGLIDNDLAKLLSPHHSFQFSDAHTPERDRTYDVARTPGSGQLLSTGPQTPYAQSSSFYRHGSRLHQTASTPTPSPSVGSFRSNELFVVNTQGGAQRRGPHERNAISANNTPLLSPGKLVDLVPPREQSIKPSNFSRPFPRRSPSTGATISRKRSASFDFSGSNLAQDLNDPFATHPHRDGPKRTDWLGPRTAKAFAAAGLLDKDKDRPNLYSGLRLETMGNRGVSPNSWRSHIERSGGTGPVRSHSRLGSEIISPSFRARSSVGGDSSPGHTRASLDLTAPPSPVSTHRTLVSSAPSSSLSQQSALQSLRERHELETEALLLALAGSKKVERELRTENEELLAYIVKLQDRISTLEAEKEQRDRVRSRVWDRSSSNPVSDVELLDKLRQDIVTGRPSRSKWDSHKQLDISRPSSRSDAHATRRSLASGGTPRSTSAASAYGSSEDTQYRGQAVSYGATGLLAASPITPVSRGPTPIGLLTSTPASETEFEDWNENLFDHPQQSSPRMEARRRLSSHSVTSLLPPMPGSMSMLVHEQPGGDSFEDGISFGSASPSSLTLVHLRSNTPKAVPVNISPITADFSFNSIPGSPRSLRLRPEEEMHLADLISLQGLEITDVIGNLEV